MISQHTIATALFLVCIATACTSTQWKAEEAEALSRHAFGIVYRALTPEERSRLEHVTFEFTTESKRLSAAATSNHVNLTVLLSRSFARPLSTYAPIFENVSPDQMLGWLSEINARYGSLAAYEDEQTTVNVQEAAAVFAIAHEIGHLLDATDYGRGSVPEMDCTGYPFCIAVAAPAAEISADRYAVELSERTNLPPVLLPVFSVIVEDLAAVLHLFNQLMLRAQEGPPTDLDGMAILRRGIDATGITIDAINRHCNAISLAMMRIEAMLADLSDRDSSAAPFARWYPEFISVSEGFLKKMGEGRDLCFLTGLLSVEVLHQDTLTGIGNSYLPHGRGVLVNQFEADYAGELIGPSKTTWKLLRASLLGSPEDRFAILTPKDAIEVAQIVQQFSRGN